MRRLIGGVIGAACLLGVSDLALGVAPSPSREQRLTGRAAQTMIERQLRRSPHLAALYAATEQRLMQQGYTPTEQYLVRIPARPRVALHSRLISWLVPGLTAQEIGDDDIGMGLHGFDVGDPGRYAANTVAWNHPDPGAHGNGSMLLDISSAERVGLISADGVICGEVPPFTCHPSWSDFTRDWLTCSLASCAVAANLCVWTGVGWGPCLFLYCGTSTAGCALGGIIARHIVPQQQCCRRWHPQEVGYACS